VRLQAVAIANPGVLDWGSGAVGSSPTTRFLFPGYSDRLAEVGEIGLLIPRPGIIRNLYVVHNAPKGNGNTIVYTVRVAGIDSPVAATLSSTSNNGADTANVVLVAAGDLVSIRVMKTLGVGQSPRNIVATVELV
jgi:hypothetical protein